MTHNLTIEPGEITIILAEDINVATRHACHTAKVLADKGIGVQLLNCGMMSRRFWKIARDEAPSHITDRHGSKLLRLETCHRGNLVADRRYFSDLRSAYGSKVLIVSGWEWSSKSWRLKEDLIFHLREIAEDEDVAIIIYSQARSNPEQGCFDRGGVGKLSAIAATISRIDDDPDEEEPTSEIVYMAPNELDKYIQKPRQIAERPKTFLDVLMHAVSPLILAIRYTLMYLNIHLCHQNSCNLKLVFPITKSPLARAFSLEIVNGIMLSVKFRKLCYEV